jgi:hypothetical protein
MEVVVAPIEYVATWPRQSGRNVSGFHGNTNSFKPGKWTESYIAGGIDADKVATIFGSDFSLGDKCVCVNHQLIASIGNFGQSHIFLSLIGFFAETATHPGELLQCSNPRHTRLNAAARQRDWIANLYWGYLGLFAPYYFEAHV